MESFRPTNSNGERKSTRLRLPPDVTDGIVEYRPYIGGSYNEYTSQGLEAQIYIVGDVTIINEHTPTWIVWHNPYTGESEWSPPLTEQTRLDITHAIHERGLVFED